MKAGQIYGKTMKFVWLKLALGAVIALVSGLLFALIVGVGIAVGNEDALAILVCIWVVITCGVFAAIERYIGYMIKAAHVAVVSTAVTTGQIPDNMVATGIDMVKNRFVTTNVYMVIDRLVSGAVKQLQDKVGRIGGMLDGIPGMDAIVSFIQTFIGIALGYIDECCLGYTFIKKDENPFKASCDGVVIYFQNAKKLLKDALGTTLIVMVVSFVAWLVPFVLFWALFAALSVPSDLFLALVISIIIAGAIKSAFIDSYMMVKTMVSYMEVAPSTQISFDIYGKLCGLSAKFKQLFNKASEGGNAVA